MEFAESIADCGSPERLPGVIFRQDGYTGVNGFAHMIDDLNSIPFPDKTLFDKHIRLEDDYLISTSRGCPHNCSYCCGHAVRNACGNDQYCRVRSVENLIEELILMKSIYKFREVFFCSPTFPHDKVWLEDFSLRYRNDVGVPFRCHAHVNHVDRDYVRLMSEAGCKSIEFGVQSVNETLRRDVLGRAESNETIYRALNLCDCEDMPCEIGHIFRLPYETEDDYISAVRFYSQFTNIHRIKTFNLTLFPSTRMLQICHEKHFVSQDFISAVERGRKRRLFSLLQR
ncbi:MAG TPA: radical SAM protein [bacterium]|nr:radical SAM protein [bacterium]